MPGAVAAVAQDALRSWSAELRMAFWADALNPSRTVLHAQHQGPLRIQKALYPEGPTTCHAIVVHPPGGIAGGDALTVSADVALASAALITTPGASKWYGSAGPVATQKVSLRIEGDLEWLPQETIVFDQARMHSVMQIHAGEAARTIGTDCVIFGRTQSGEAFRQGEVMQSIGLHVGGQLIWEERLRVLGGDPMFFSTVGFRGEVAASTTWALLPGHDRWSADDLSALRGHCPQIAWTAIEARLLIGRQIGPARLLRQHQVCAWQWLRPRVLRTSPSLPRIWAT